MKFYLFFFFIFSLSLNQLIAQIIINEPPRALYYDRTRRITNPVDFNNFRDVFHSDKLLMGRRRIMGSIFYNTSRVFVYDGYKLNAEIKQAIGYDIRFRFLEEMMVNATFYQNFNRRAVAEWTSDYSYSIGRYNWENRKINFGYENYVQNKYKSTIEQFGENFLEGYYFVSANIFLPKETTDKIAIDETSNLRFITFSRYAFKYHDYYGNIKGGLFGGKPSVGGSFRYTIGWHFYIESALYYYFNSGKYQQPWDPDYTYGFGYANYRSFRLFCTYGNWATNRFPWRKKTYPGYGFPDGDFRLGVSWVW